MRITGIDRAENGWVVNYIDVGSDEEGKDVDIAHKEVIQDDAMGEDGGLAHVKATRSLLWSILNILDERGNKHHDYRLMITIENREGELVEDGFGYPPEPVSESNQK